MKLALCYDTETSGLPLWSTPSEDPAQPHMVEIGAILVDLDTRTELQAINLVIRPDDTWSITDETTKIHGISHEMACAVGIDEALAMDVFLDLWLIAEVRIGFNEPFDARMMRIAMKRFFAEDTMPDGTPLSDAWKDAPAIDVCQMAMPFCKLPATPKMIAAGRGGQPKKPKLAEAFEVICGRPIEQAHTARGDTRATLELYYACLALQVAADAV